MMFICSLLIHCFSNTYLYGWIGLDHLELYLPTTYWCNQLIGQCMAGLDQYCNARCLFSRYLYPPMIFISGLLDLACRVFEGRSKLVQRRFLHVLTRKNYLLR